ncbi:MAG: HTH-type transcriptional regulator DmlR [Herbaspirillum frisingense]|uniref:HTH-type transcriptional regulator DmlR n=1 Tax=Herbaspirillum frisingense TaxID=92645 RepID=A0A7V8FXH0_9BURK|nr:MAG: HTH-type transcriptional regulator DmlR [Herbaspirillum frisingense]
MDKLQSMAVFVDVVTRSSFTAAAEAHDISAPMVGKHIRFLEQQLGARLLTRTTRRQHLTEIGSHYVERCRQILEDVRSAESQAAELHSVARGTLRIAAPVSFGSGPLSSAITDYLAAYPEVSVELTLNNRVEDLVAAGYDAAIRIGYLQDSGFTARELQPYRMLICAAPAYLERAGTPLKPADLARHECLGFTHWRRTMCWQLAPHEPQEPAPSRFVADNGQALLTAALNGFGIIMQPEILLADAVAAGRLVPLLDEWLPAPRPMHLLYPHDRRNVPKLTTFADFIVERFGAAQPQQKNKQRPRKTRPT